MYQRQDWKKSSTGFHKEFGFEEKQADQDPQLSPFFGKLSLHHQYYPILKTQGKHWVFHIQVCSLVANFDICMVYLSFPSKKMFSSWSSFNCPCKLLFSKVALHLIISPQNMTRTSFGRHKVFTCPSCILVVCNS